MNRLQIAIMGGKKSPKRRKKREELPTIVLSTLDGDAGNEESRANGFGTAIDSQEVRRFIPGSLMRQESQCLLALCTLRWIAVSWISAALAHTRPPGSCAHASG